MIKAVVFMDGELWHYLGISDSLKELQNPLTRLLYVDAKYGYTDNQEYIQYIIESEDYKRFEVIIITNSLTVFNNSRLKEIVSDDKLLKNYYIIDKDYILKDVNNLTSKELHTSHNLEKLYINNGFEKLEMRVLEKLIDKIQK